MSGPKCDDFFLSDWEYIQQQEEEERRFQEEKRRKRQEAARRMAEEKRRREEEARRRAAEEERRRREEEERRREEEARRLAEKQKREREQQFQSDVQELMAQLQQVEKARPESGAEEAELEQAFFDAYISYQAAAEGAGEEAISYEFSPKMASLMIENLQKETARLRELALAKRCRKRVNEIIDETIIEMGYELVGVAEKKGDVRTESRIYQYDKNTAISVIEENGQFTMEVVALDTQSRRATETEAQALEQKMRAFCDDYDKICERLEQDERLQRRSVFHMPPDKKYARVVNKNKYENTNRRRKHSEDYADEQKGVQGRGNNSTM